jgi:hypothetical protein
MTLPSAAAASSSAPADCLPLPRRRPPLVVPACRQGKEGHHQKRQHHHCRRRQWRHQQQCPHEPEQAGACRRRPRAHFARAPPAPRASVHRTSSPGRSSGRGARQCACACGEPACSLQLQRTCMTRSGTAARQYASARVVLFSPDPHSRMSSRETSRCTWPDAAPLRSQASPQWHERPRFRPWASEHHRAPVLAPLGRGGGGGGGAGGRGRGMRGKLSHDAARASVRWAVARTAALVATPASTAADAMLNHGRKVLAAAGLRASLGQPAAIVGFGTRKRAGGHFVGQPIPVRCSSRRALDTFACAVACTADLLPPR